MRARGLPQTSWMLALLAGLTLFLLAPAPTEAAEVTSGVPGESFTITLTGAKARREVRAELAGSTTSATADANGRARLKITVPDVEAGEYTLHLSGGLTKDVVFRIRHRPGQDERAVPATSKAAPVVAAGSTAPVVVPARAIKDPATLVAGVGLVVAGISALLAINARARARRRRFVPVGFG